MRRPDLLRAFLLASALVLAACGEKKEEVQQAAAPPPPPPKQEVPDETVSDVAKRLGIDARVRMDEGERPRSGDAAADLKRLEAALKFFDAMVTAKADALRPMLGERDRATLAAMEKDGQWKVVNQDVDRVSVGFGGDKVLAIYMVGDRFEGQLWQVLEADGGVRFTALPTPPGVVEKLEGTKAEPRIQQWETVVRTLADAARKPDEAVEVQQQDRSVQGEDAGASGGAPASPPSSPGGPGSPSSPGGPRRPGG